MEGDMQEDFARLADLIRDICGRKVAYYIANPGNWGDALIRHGTLRFFQEHRIRVNELRNKKAQFIWPAVVGGIVIYGGGGGWCSHYDHSFSIVNKLRRRFRVIVLPSTYEKRYVLPNTFFCRRDIYESEKNMPDSFFCHDMAFAIGSIKKEAGRGVGYFFRTDKESAGRIKIPETNCDLSMKGTQYSGADAFFSEVARYEVIYTDRLHIGIAACLLGRELHLFPGSYFKNRAIFDSSIRGRFSNAFYHDDYTMLPTR